MSSRFVYVTYIRTTREKLWEALTRPEFTRRYFFGVTMDTDWKAGSPWKMVHADGRITDTGEVLEARPPERLVLKWRNEFAELKPEGYTQCTFELSQQGELTRLDVGAQHEPAEARRDRAHRVGRHRPGGQLLAGQQSFAPRGAGRGPGGDQLAGHQHADRPLAGQGP